MNYARLWVAYKYAKEHASINLGDCTQSIAVENLLARMGYYNPILVERDSLPDYNDDPVKAVMQGWFTYNGLEDSTGKLIKTFPISNKINPIWLGFHLSMEGYSRKKFKTDCPAMNSELGTNPIGCRDISTYKFMKNLGYNAYPSLCMTCTFDKRFDLGSQKIDFCIDCNPKPGEVVLSNEMPINGELTLDQYQVYEHIARERLRILSVYARSVRTSRLHVYLPCVAMGIPVKYEGTSDERTDIINIITPDTIDILKPLVIKNFVHQVKSQASDVVPELFKAISKILGNKL